MNKMADDKAARTVVEIAGYIAAAQKLSNAELAEWVVRLRLQYPLEGETYCYLLEIARRLYPNLDI